MEHLKEYGFTDDCVGFVRTVEGSELTIVGERVRLRGFPELAIREFPGPVRFSIVDNVLSLVPTDCCPSGEQRIPLMTCTPLPMFIAWAAGVNRRHHM